MHPHHRLILLAVSLYLQLSLFPHFLRVLQWNAGVLQARSPELLHFISSHPVDLICIQESNLNLSSSFRIPGFSALRSDGTHSRSGIFSTDVTDASGCVITFVRQGLSFSELSTSFLSSLDSYSDYVEVNISLNDSSSLSFFNIYAPPIRSSPKDSRTNFFSPSILPSYVEAVKFSRFHFHFHRKRTAFTASASASLAVTSRNPGSKVNSKSCALYWIILGLYLVLCFQKPLLFIRLVRLVESDTINS